MELDDKTKKAIDDYFDSKSSSEIISKYLDEVTELWVHSRTKTVNSTVDEEDCRYDYLNGLCKGMSLIEAYQPKTEWISVEDVKSKFKDLKMSHELPNDNTSEYNLGFVKAMCIAINSLPQKPKTK